MNPQEPAEHVERSDEVHREAARWFIYLGDHHEGPFSMEEISVRLLAGSITSSSYVWSEGMADWKPMSELPDFSGLHSGRTRFIQMPRPAPSSAPIAPTASSGGVTALGADEPSPVSAAIPAAGALAKAQLKPAAAPARRPAFALAGTLRGIALIFGLALASVALVLSGITDPLIQAAGLRPAVEQLSERLRPALLPWSDRFPVLRAVISPIGPLPDLSAEDYRRLQAAAFAHRAGGAPAGSAGIELGVAARNPEQPRVHLVSGMPDGTKFLILLKGVPGTLLNRMDFTAQWVAEQVQGVASTEPLRAPGAQPLARGEYEIEVVDAPDQTPEIAARLAAMPAVPGASASLPPQRRLLARTKAFLGGARDEAYATRLQDYQQQLRKRAEAEIAELKQFTSALEGQLSETLTKFSAFRGRSRPTAVQRAGWAGFHEQWGKFMEGLRADGFSKWTEESLANERYFGAAYRQVIAAATELERMHATHHEYFAPAATPDPKSIDIQLGEAAAHARSSIDTLKAKVAQLEASLSAVAGLPGREGNGG